MADSLLPIAERFTSTDVLSEIQSLSYLSFEAEFPAPPTSARLAIVFVEPRLLERAGDTSLQSGLLRRLRRFKGDLRAEGLHSRFFAAKLYRGRLHKDGRIVIALRRFLKQVKGTFPNLEGAIFVGSFPEATLVRRCVWSPGFWNPKRLLIEGDVISERTDIVLSDLNGAWESTYRQDDFEVERIAASPDANTPASWFDGKEGVRDCEFSSTQFEIGKTGPFRDAFYLDDAIFETLERSPSKLRLRIQAAETNLEVPERERWAVNVIAQPEISVSRINAYHVAFNPSPALKGDDGTPLLDAGGRPQAIRSAQSKLDLVDPWSRLFTEPDFNLERRLLIDYFDRNHRFRTGAFAHLDFRGAVISGTTDFDPAGYEPIVNAAAGDFGACFKMANADLREYVQFHKTPAVLKYIMAHSDARISAFRGGYDVAGLESDVGGLPLRWVRVGDRHVPSYQGLDGTADIFLHRAMWLHGTLAASGASLMIHGGCNVNSIAETQKVPYHDSSYGRWSNSEGLLFYTNAVALFSRAKTFNDAPQGFADAYRDSDRANFGSCLKRYFRTQASDATLTTYNVQRKRVYFWSVTGDWTLRLRNRAGLGIVNGELASVELQPNRAWIDDWNFDSTANRVRAIGDVDGDFKDEIVVTSDWGIGILKHDGHSFRALMVAPRDTFFGEWRHTGDDDIKDVRDFTGSGQSDILITSPWGLGVLTYSGSTLTTSRIHANGTRLGEWTLNTLDNRYWGAGQFDTDRKLEVVLTSPWGIGIVSLESGTHLFLARNGTRLGGWKLSTRVDQIRAVADLDGDGQDEILMSSPWGIGVLKLQNGALASVVMYPNGSDIDGHIVGNTNEMLVDNLCGGARRQILVKDGAGLHVLELVDGRLTRIAFAQQSKRIAGRWVIDTPVNQLQLAGNLAADDRAEVFIRSPWGFGVLGLDPSNVWRCQIAKPYGAVLGDWPLQDTDEVVGSGRFTGAANRELLVVKK